MRRGFTLIELLVVIAMIAIISAAFGTSVNAARRRAHIARATQEVKEMTNAILAYEQYAEGRSLKSVEKNGWTECSESSMQMVLGGKSGANGEAIPVLFNGHVIKGYLRDPWNKPYQYMIVSTATLSGGGSEEDRGVQLKTAAALPNFFRLSDGEKR